MIENILWWSIKLKNNNNMMTMMLMTNVTPLEMTNRHERHRQRRRARVITKQHENKHEIRRCSMDTFARCLHMMQEVTSNSSLAFPTNMDELDVTCK